MPPKPRLPAAPPNTISLYVRLSRAADDTNLSLEGMLADEHAMAEREGLRVVGVHIDDGLSGAIRDRPEFLAWLADVHECRSSALGTWGVDRLTREGVNVAARILDTIEGKDPTTGRIIRAPARLIDTKGLDSASDETSFRIRFVIAAEVARGELVNIRDRARARARRIAAAGQWGGGVAPFGVRAIPNPDGKGWILAEEPKEAEALRPIGRRLIAGGKRGAAVRALNRGGWVTRRGNPWAYGALMKTLTSEAVRAIVFTPAENRALAQVLVSHPDLRTGGRAPSRLLSGVLVCAGCMRRLVVAPQSGGPVRYRCQSFSDAAPCLAPVVIVAEPLEAAVSAAWLDGWGRLPETEAVRPMDETAERLTEVLDEIDVVSAHVLQERGVARAEALARLEALETRRDELEALPVTSVTVLRETGRTYADAWHEVETEDQRELLLGTVGSLSVRTVGRGKRVPPLERITDAFKLDPAAIDEAHGLN